MQPVESISSVESESSRTTASHPGTWKGVALVLAALTCAVASIVGIWWWGERTPVSAVEAYWPLQNGLSSLSRVTSADGRVTYAASNATDQRASELVRDGHFLRLGSISTALGMDLVADPSVLSALGQARVSRAHDVALDGSLVTSTESILMALPEQMGLVEVSSDNAYGHVAAIFSPPVALLRSDMPISSTQVQTGLVSYPVYSATFRYTATLTFEAVEAAHVPAGIFDDCQRVMFRLEFAGVENTRSRAWYCRGVGNVKQVDLDANERIVRQSEVIALQNKDRIYHEAMTATLPLPQSTAALSSKLIWSMAPSAVLTAVWRYKDDGVATILAEPVVVDALNLVLVVTYRGDVRALNRDTGQLVWRFRTGGPIYSAPAVVDGVAYFGSTDRRVYAVDVKSGTYRWSFATDDIVSVSPVVADGVVYAGSQDHSLYALKAETGQLLHEFDLGGAISTMPIAADGVVYVGSDDGGLYALNTADFSIRWAFAAGNALAAAPLLVGDVLYIATQNQILYALNAHLQQSEPEIRWQFQSRNAASANLLYDRNRLYLNTTGALYAIDTQTHSLLWRYVDLNVYGNPIIMNDVLVAQTSAGVVELDAATGVVRRATQLVEDAPNAGLSTDGQRIYVGYFDSLVLALGDPARVNAGTATPEVQR